MDLENLILAVFFLLSLPLLGTVFAMALGVVIILSRRRDRPPRKGAALLFLDALARRLRIGAAFFGCSVDGARYVADRRCEERRTRARRQQARAQAERRQDERRRWDRRSGNLAMG